jgi:hypothetical protein
MPASEAQIRASQLNGCKGKGPVSTLGKEASRANSYKHGLTGAGIVMPEEDAAEVERLALAFRQEFQVEGEAGRVLANRMATMAVRMDRSAEQETAALSERVRRVMDEFEAPEGVDAETAERLRVEAGKIALFDDSKPACLARKYEAAAERCFYRTMKELRQLKRESTAVPAGESASEVAALVETSLARLGSFFPDAPKSARSNPSPSLAPSKPASSDWDPFASDHFDVPIAIGKRR